MSSLESEKSTFETSKSELSSQLEQANKEKSELQKKLQDMDALLKKAADSAHNVEHASETVKSSIEESTHEVTAAA